VFGKKYHEYWENRKDSTLKEDINNESRSAISSIQRLVHQNLIERANNARDDKKYPLFL
jgi:predicted transcriptional regulator